MTLLSLLALYLSFRCKQLMCDYILQTSWMAYEKGKIGLNGYKALLAHAGVHSLGTLIICLIFSASLWWLFLVDLAIHSFIDRVKARITDKYGWKPSHTKFWWALGVDQELHNLTHLAFILVIVSKLGFPV